MDDGYIMFHLDPLLPVARLGAPKVGSLRCVEMRYRTNHVAIVSGGPQPKWDDHTVVLYDFKKDEAQYKVMTKEPVLDVKMTRERLIVILRSRIIVLAILSGKSLAEFETGDNPNGVCALSPSARKVVFPSQKGEGHIQIQDLDREDSATQSTPPVIVKAHGNAVVCAALNQPGNLVATASTQGTNIHVYDSDTKKTRMFRRGVDKANIYCLNFSKDSKYLCCSSDKGTVHVWAVKDLELNPVTKINPLLGLAPEMRSYAQFTVPAESACICSFGSGDSIYAICLDGSFQKYKLGRDGSQTETGRNCFRVSYDKYPIVGELYG